MELITARAQQQHEALWAIQERTARPHVAHRALAKRDLANLVEVLYERLDEIHGLAKQGLAKPTAEVAHEALSRAVMTGRGMDEAVAMMLSTPLPLPRD